MSKEIKNETTKPLYRITYHFVSPQHTLRNGQYILPASSEQEAYSKANALLVERFGHSKTYFRITKTRLF